MPYIKNEEGIEIASTSISKGAKETLSDGRVSQMASNFVSIILNNLLSSLDALLAAKSRSFTCFIAPQTHNEALKRCESLMPILAKVEIFIVDAIGWHTTRSECSLEILYHPTWAAHVYLSL